jgi:hypothetical protein
LHTKFNRFYERSESIPAAVVVVDTVDVADVVDAVDVDVVAIVVGMS